jgi:glyoxylase-like metal-dependent hydrolase (beta-lactamase superfamily II)
MYYYRICSDRMVFELTENVWQLDLSNVNAYLVNDGGVVTLIDSGTPWGVSGLVNAIEGTDYSVSDIDRAILTHYDIDHVGGLVRLGIDVPVFIGTPDATFFDGRRQPPLTNSKGVLHRMLGPFMRGNDLSIEIVEDGDEIGSFTAYHTPGHTPGHMVYLSESLSLGFVGDLVLERGGELTPSPWYISYDADRVRESITDLADRQPAIETIGFGHGVPFLRDGSTRLAKLGRTIIQ